MGAFAGAEKTPRSFLCSNDLWGAFEKRASDLECSVDWLICEAMKRLLESGPGAGSQPRQTVARPHHQQQQQQQLKPPLPKLRPPSLPPLKPPHLPHPPHPPQPPQPRLRRLAFVIDGQQPISLDAYAADRDSPIVIGRSPKEAQLVLRDPGVSRQHAMVERNSMTGGLVIVDMASTNGVILNGQRVARAALRLGDRIEIGPFTIDVVV